MALLIKNVHILGSEQRLPDKLDVYISGEKIAALGRFPNKQAETIIDGQGCYLAPGFIDVDNDSDHYLSIFSNPSQGDFLKQGITTIIGGTCGASLAPLIYGDLDSISAWADTREINVDWHTVKEYLKVLDKRPLGVNYATLTGHTTIRQAITGQPPRNLTKNEQVVFGELLRRSLKEGSFGLSTGLAYVGNRDTPYSELKNFALIVKEFNGVYSTHLRKTGKGLEESINETIKLAEETGIKTLVSHLVPLIGEEGEYEKALERIDNLQSDLDFNFDIYPYDVSVLPLYTFLPEWAQKDGLSVMRMSLRDKWLSEKILNDLPKIDPKSFKVAKAPGNDSLVGYSLQDLKKLYLKRSDKEALLKLMVSTNLQATVFYQNLNLNLIKRAILNPRSFIATNAASFSDNHHAETLKPERATSTFSRFLEIMDKEKVISMDAAVSKVTALPAAKFSISERGRVVEGFFADLVGFDQSFKINFVVVNGKMALEDGKLKDLKGGKVLRHNR